MKAKQTIRAIFSNAIAWIISAICLIPLLLIIFNSVDVYKRQYSGRGIGTDRNESNRQV